MRALPSLVLLSTITLSLVLPRTAAACGGLFCNNTSRVPVEQAGERVLFEVPGDGTVTATVEITYTGAAEDFAWVVPVPDTPVLGVAAPRGLAILEDTTRRLFVPPTIVCSTDEDDDDEPDPWDDGDDSWRAPSSARNNTTTSSGGGGCFGGGGGSSTWFSYDDDDDVAYGDDDDDASDDDDAADVPELPPVRVKTLPQVGPYDPTVVSSEDPDQLVGWLNDNGYLVTEAMRPFMDQYVAAGMKFLAMRLAPEAGVQEIAPIRMTYPSERPMLPIVLTSVAAEPEMNILVFVAGETRYQSANYANLTVDGEDVRLNPLTGQSNYDALLGMKIDLAGGHAFAAEAVDDARNVRGRSAAYLKSGDPTLREGAEWLESVLVSHRAVSRLATRLSPPEMTVDPVFEPISGSSVDRVIDLSAWEFDRCAPEANRILACGSQYCGEGAYCAQTWDNIGCMCPEGSVGRVVERMDPVWGIPIPQVVCQDALHDMMSSAPPLEEPDGEPEDVCATVDCGVGTCVALNGFATCACGPATAAVVPWGSDVLTCQEPDRVWAQHEGLAWGPALGEEGDRIQPLTRRLPPPFGGFLLVFGGLFAGRRVRHRR